MSEPTADDCIALRRELGLAVDQSDIETGDACFHVYIYENIKRPPMIKFRGYPINYHIGDEKPVLQ